MRAIILDSNTKFDFGSFDSITAKISPLPHNYDTVLASSAMDACSSVFELLSYINDKDNKRIQDIATFATDTVDMYIQEKENLNMNDKNLETVIASHPLMIREKQVQESIWKYLQGAKTIEKEDVDILEKMQLNNVKGNLDLPIL